VSLHKLYWYTLKIKKLMADRRDPNKVLVSCYIDKELRDMTKEALSKIGITFTDFVCIKILELLNESADEIIQKLKEQDGRTTQGKAKRNLKARKNKQ
jgi:antitoxin component of RelBE/YafQ-DinJ toxin-antitoxin module